MWYVIYKPTNDFDYCVVGGKARDIKRIALAYGCLISKSFKTYENANKRAIGQIGGNTND